MKRFEYLEPSSAAEICSLLSRYKDEAKVVAGGTDLLVSIKKRVLTPKYVIGMRQIPDFNDIDYTDTTGVRIGTLAILRDVEMSSIIRDKLPILADAASMMASPAIRNMATIGGNLCNAAPSADCAPPLIALGAQAEIMGSKGKRTIAMESFFTGSGTTALDFEEILVHIQVPNPPPHTVGSYLKLRRTAVDIAIVGVAVVATMDLEHKTIADARIVLGAVAPTPMRAHQAEEIMSGKAIAKGQWIEEAAQVASEEAEPITDVRASADYRRAMVKAFVREAIRQVIGSPNLIPVNMKE